MLFTNKILNFLAFQISWFVCCYNANALPWLGILIIAAWISVLLIDLPDRNGEVKLLIGAAVLGYTLDSILVLTGMLDFPDTAHIGWPTTFWMVALWMNLAATLHFSLAWLQKKYLLAAILGGLAGPLSYYAGTHFSAIYLPHTMSLAAVALEWTIAMPLLLWLADHTTKPAGNSKLNQPGYLT